MKKTTLLSFGTAVISAAVISFIAYGCSDDDSTATPKPDSGTSSSGGSSGGSSGSPGTDAPSIPPKPTLGVQIDRMARPGVNTALQQTFKDDGTREAAQNAYNADGDKAGWVAKYKASFAASLAIYDGIDQACGNQAFASADAGADGSVEKYGTLASVLADDRLWLDTSATCGDKYLSVELNGTGAIPNTDCGGRTLKTDVIDVTYTALASDPASLTDPNAYIGDNIARQDAKTNGTTFPYLSAPQ
jgi:hypothetical protein